jgi:hypothetical protein
MAEEQEARIRAERAIAEERARAAVEAREAAIKAEMDAIRGRSPQEVLQEQVLAQQEQMSALLARLETK